MIKGLKGPIALGTIRTSLVLGLRLVIQAGTLLLVLNDPEMNERQGMWFIYSENQKNVGVNGGYVVLQGNE